MLTARTISGRLARRFAAGVAATALSLSLVVAVPQSEAVAQQNADQLLAHFESVVFGSEIEGVAEAKRIQKWVTPIRVSVSAMKGEMLQKADGKRELKLSYVRPDETQVALIRKHLTMLVKLTGVTSEERDDDAGKKANFFIKFVPRLAMGQPFLAEQVDPAILQRLARPGVCYFLTRSVRTGAMFRALIVVNAELPAEQMDACLLEEMTQAFGLPNDSDVLAPSVFNQKSTQQELSESDVLMLRTLYDKRLPPGTPRADALRIGREILRDLTGGG